MRKNGLWPNFWIEGRQWSFGQEIICNILFNSNAKIHLKKSTKNKRKKEELEWMNEWMMDENVIFILWW